MERFRAIILIIVAASSAYAGTRYDVIPTGNDNAAGTSWAAAFQSYRHADSVATTGDTIWVAAGTYTPAVSDPSAYFKLKSGVASYGGFAGTETALNQRDWKTNVTTLSGGGTTHTVVYSVVCNNTAVLDGFVISGGSSTTDGAGLNLLVASPTLANLTITGNHTTANGGGLCNSGGNPTITNCSFTGNSANYGGGMYNYSGSVPVITGCTFQNNSASVFGGGFYNTGNTLCVQDALFDGNHATTGGGGLYEDHGSAYVNLTLYGNTSKYGGAIFVTGSSATIANTILWNDTATTNGSDIYNTASSGSTNISYCIVQGSVSGTGLAGSGAFTDGGHNLDLDPLFTDSSAHNFSLTSSSPAVDSGNNAVVTATQDLAGNARTSDGTVDIGAYEYQGAPLVVQMTSFVARGAENSVTITWTTATETNNAGFGIERRAMSGQRSAISVPSSNSQWMAVTFVRGNGTSATPHNYSFVDQDLAPGFYSYRIRQTDYRGAFVYSKEVQVVVATAPRTFSLGQNFPNPFNPTTTVRFTIPTDARVALNVYDIIGREVITLVDRDLKAGEYQQVEFDASLLSSGVYFYKITATGVDGEKFEAMKKMVLIK